MYKLNAMAFAAGLILGGTSAMSQPPVGANSVGDYVVSATGLGNGGKVAISEAGTNADRRLYLYTGPNPSSAGSVMFYMINQPANQAPFMQLTLVAPDARYLGTFKPGVWPFPTMLVADYEDIQFPILCADWQTSVPLMPNSTYAINVHAEPRRFQPAALGVPTPAQGSGAGVIQ